MKLVFSIVQDQDAVKVIKELNKNRFSVTKLCSSGGFLKTGNTTLLVGVPDSKVNSVIDIIKKNSKSRKQVIDSSTLSLGMDGVLSSYHDEVAISAPSMPLDGYDGISAAYPVEVIVGGATIFILNVERFVKL